MVQYCTVKGPRKKWEFNRKGLPSGHRPPHRLEENSKVQNEPKSQWNNCKNMLPKQYCRCFFFCMPMEIGHSSCHTPKMTNLINTQDCKKLIQTDHFSWCCMGALQSIILTCVTEMNKYFITIQSSPNHIRNHTCVEVTCEYGSRHRLLHEEHKLEHFVVWWKKPQSVSCENYHYSYWWQQKQSRECNCDCWPYAQLWTSRSCISIP